MTFGFAPDIAYMALDGLTVNPLIFDLRQINSSLGFNAADECSQLACASFSSSSPPKKHVMNIFSGPQPTPPVWGFSFVRQARVLVIPVRVLDVLHLEN
jgi:hypothetical protein